MITQGESENLPGTIQRSGGDFLETSLLSDLCGWDPGSRQAGDWTDPGDLGTLHVKQKGSHVCPKNAWHFNILTGFSRFHHEPRSDFARIWFLLIF